MACSCNSNSAKFSNKKEFNFIEKKLGKCKFCIRTSIFGMVISIGTLEFIKSFSTFSNSAYFMIALVAIGFTTLFFLHVIFYMYNKFS